MLMGAAFTNLHPTSHLDPVYRTGASDFFMKTSLPHLYHIIVILFVTSIRSTAPPAEVELLQSQSALANFIKPLVSISPVPNWPPCEPGFWDCKSYLAKIGYQGDDGFDDPMNPVQR